MCKIPYIIGVGKDIINNNRKRKKKNSTYNIRHGSGNKANSATWTISCPLMTRPNTISFSFKSGIGAVVMKRSNPLLKYFPFDVPSMNASCLILVNHHSI